eukprot:2055696-Prymnesium_polylepis.1
MPRKSTASERFFLVLKSGCSEKSASHMMSSTVRNQALPQDHCSKARDVAVVRSASDSADQDRQIAGNGVRATDDAAGGARARARAHGD